jgi:hypothetical protein
MTGAKRLYNVRLIQQQTTTFPNLSFSQSPSSCYLDFGSGDGVGRCKGAGIRFSDEYEWGAGVDTEMNELNGMEWEAFYACMLASGISTLALHGASRSVPDIGITK